VPSPAHHAATLQSWERAENGEVGENLETESILEQLLLDRRKDQVRPIYSDGEPLYPYHTPQDEPLEADHETPASLTSAATASPVAHEISTPGNEMIPSPTAKTALPIAFPPQRTSAAWSTRRSEGAHSRSYNRLNSLAGSGAASAGRRRATRSATSSMSPASAFLSNFGRLAVEEVTEPDDEGQEIGDHSGWIIGRKIGYGGFSVVKEVSTMENGKRVVRAVKIVRKQPQTIRDDTQNEHIQAEFEHEVSIWRFLKHQYILPLISVYDTPFAMFCITKLNVGGTLHDLLRSRSQQYPRAERGLSASVAKRYTYQLAAAVRYLHEDVRVVHRDIKLENCLLDMSAPDAKAEGGNVLLCDFGMADFIHNETRVDPEPADSRARQTTNRNIGPSDTSSHLSSHSGTTMPDASLDNRDATLSVMGSLEYAAPELISASSTLFSPAADIWAFGVVIYALLTGSLPFSHAMKEKLVVVIEKTQWDVGPLYQCPAVKGGGPAGLAAVDLVKGCLTHDPEDRWDIEQVLNCRWLMGCREYYGDGIVTEEGPGWR